MNAMSFVDVLFCGWAGRYSQLKLVRDCLESKVGVCAQAMMQGINPHLVQFLDIRIRRDHVLEDALNHIVGRPHELKKPLRVTFISEGVEEEGQDQVIISFSVTLTT